MCIKQQMKQNIKLKQIQLKSKKQQKLKNIQSIKQLKQEIESLKWRIPQRGVHEDIQQLKQSIKIPMILNKQQELSLQQIIQSQEKKTSKEAESSLINFLSNKKQMLLKMDKLRTEGNLYQSHRRVILKQYLEMLRTSTRKQKQTNENLEKNGLELEKVRKQYEDLVKQTDKTSEEMAVSRLY